MDVEAPQKCVNSTQETWNQDSQKSAIDEYHDAIQR